MLQIGLEDDQIPKWRKERKQTWYERKQQEARVLKVK